MEHHRPAQHQLYRPAKFDRRRRGQRGLRPRPQLRAKSRTDELSDHPHLVPRQTEHVGKHVAMVHDTLRGFVERELVAIPDRYGRMRLDRIMGLWRYRIMGIYRDRRGRIGLLCIATLANDFCFLGDQVGIDIRSFRRIRHSDGVRGCFGLFERIRDCKRYILAVITNNVVVERRSRLVQHESVAEARRDTRNRNEVAAFQDCAHAGHLTCARRIDGLYLAFSNRCTDRHGVEHIREAVVGSISGRAGDLERAVNAGTRLTDFRDRRSR